MQQIKAKEEDASRVVAKEEAVAFQSFLDQVSVFKLGRLKQGVALETADLGLWQSAAVQDVVEAEFGKLVAKWGEVVETPVLETPDREAHPRATPAQIYRASAMDDPPDAPFDAPTGSSAAGSTITTPEE